MTSWQEKLDGDTLPWLLEETDSGVRYLALRNLLALSQDDQNLVTAKQQAQQQGPILTTLDAMSPKVSGLNRDPAISSNTAAPFSP